jgi:DNA-binding SARP family transcriptional activator
LAAAAAIVRSGTELSVKFEILGPLEVTAGSGRLELGGTRQQIVVATLLLNANRLVTTDRLLEAIYGEDLPPTSRSQAQISVSSLRRLFAAHGQHGVISTRSHGYVIQVDSGQLDFQRFGEMVAAARAARAERNLDLAVANYRDALRLWRGPALDGIDSQLVRAAASRLDEQRIATTEDRISLELDLGRHYELVTELTELVEELPLRERLRGQLMLALYRCGRTAEALQVYRQARHIMVAELGIEPSERLRKLEHDILTSAPVLAPPAEPTRMQAPHKQVPNLLPTDIADFTGRAEQLAQIRQDLIRAAAQDARSAVPVTVIVGKGGVGKTCVAVRASHDVATHYPDGQLFADLHGGGADPVSPVQVLGRFLRALGVPPSQIPEGLDERAEVYRNLLADRKVLVVLDDAVSENQVSPLLPGSGPSAVIITSRRRLAYLAGAAHVEVSVFAPARSLELLTRIAGAERVTAQPEAAAAVARYCGHLPLALRIAGARLSARPHWSIQKLVDRLADETGRLDELRHGDMGIRPSISLTYESASEPARKLFRRLALLNVPYFSGWLCAALLDQPYAYAEDLLDDLVNAQLIEISGNGVGAHSQYRFHDLIRVFARERLAAEESAPERQAALERALGALLHIAEEAHRRHYGGDYVGLQSDARRWPLPSALTNELIKDPLAWYDRERATLVAGIRQAAQAGAVDLCWSLALRAVTLFESRIYLDDWRETHEVALAATQKAHHVRGQAAMLYSIGSLHIAHQRFDEATETFNAAARLFRSVGDEEGIALVTRYLALLDLLSGRLEQAAAGYERSLAIFRRTGDMVATAYVLHGLAQIRLELNDVAGAKELLSEALRLTRTVHCGRVEAQVLYRIGEASLQSGDLAEAVGAFELVLASTRNQGDPVGEAYALIGMGLARTRLGEFGQARATLRRALELAGAAGQPLTEARALLGLGELALASGHPEQAVDLGRRALDVFNSMGAPRDAVRAANLLDDAGTAPGDRGPVTAVMTG